MTRKTKLALAALGAAAALCCAAILLRPGDKAVTAVIKQDGVVLWEIDLSQLTGATVFPVDGENGLWNMIVAEPGRICVNSASCPDQICVNQGWISDSSRPIVCLPNKLVIEISGGEAQLDVATQ